MENTTYPQRLNTLFGLTFSPVEGKEGTYRATLPDTYMPATAARLAEELRIFAETYGDFKFAKSIEITAQEGSGKGVIEVGTASEFLLSKLAGNAEALQRLVTDIPDLNKTQAAVRQFWSAPGSAASKYFQSMALVTHDEIRGRR